MGACDDAGCWILFSRGYVLTRKTLGSRLDMGYSILQGDDGSKRVVVVTSVAVLAVAVGYFGGRWHTFTKLSSEQGRFNPDPNPVSTFYSQPAFPTGNPELRC